MQTAQQTLATQLLAAHIYLTLADGGITQINDALFNRALALVAQHPSNPQQARALQVVHALLSLQG